jgi:hypothetical protein
VVGSAAALLLHSGVAFWCCDVQSVQRVAFRLAGNVVGCALDCKQGGYRSHASSQLPHPPLHTTMPPLCCS